MSADSIDARLNLNPTPDAQKELQRQNVRLQLLLNLSNRITSNLELREVLRVLSVNIREVMQCGAVTFSLRDAASGNFRVVALDFPHGKGFLKEGFLHIPGQNDPAVRALDTLKPVIVSAVGADDISRESYEIVVAEGIRSHCFIPLVNRDRALGVLAILRTTAGRMSPMNTPAGSARRSCRCWARRKVGLEARKVRRHVLG